jgi:hypothetical protein
MQRVKLPLFKDFGNANFPRQALRRTGITPSLKLISKQRMAKSLRAGFPGLLEADDIRGPMTKAACRVWPESTTPRSSSLAPKNESASSIISVGRHISTVLNKAAGVMLAAMSARFDSFPIGAEGGPIDRLAAKDKSHRAIAATPCATPLGHVAI